MKDIPIPRYLIISKKQGFMDPDSFEFGSRSGSSLFANPDTDPKPNPDPKPDLNRTGIEKKAGSGSGSGFK
jgi:hypothetical protein